MDAASYVSGSMKSETTIPSASASMRSAFPSQVTSRRYGTFLRISDTRSESRRSDSGEPSVSASNTK